MNENFKKHAVELNSLRFFLLNTFQQHPDEESIKFEVSQKLKTELINDCKRSLITFEPLTDKFIVLENAYSYIVLQVFELFPPEISELYLEGILDIIEAPFVSLMLPKPIKFNKIIVILYEIIRKSYQETHFSLDYYVRISSQLSRALKVDYDISIKETQMLKIAITFGLHCSKQPQYSIFMSRYTIENGVEKAAFTAGCIVERASKSISKEPDFCSYFSLLWQEFDKITSKIEANNKKEMSPVFGFLATTVAILLFK